MDVISRPPLPPFNAETAGQKTRMAEDAWNTRDPTRVVLAYTLDSRWRNRVEFLNGRAEIEAFLIRKWNRELFGLFDITESQSGSRMSGTTTLLDRGHLHARVKDICG